MKRVLIVSEDHATRDLLTQVLEVSNCSVETAASHARAAELMRADPPDAMFLDLKTAAPESLRAVEVTGEEAARAHVPVAIISTRDAAADARQVPAHLHLTRPFGLAALLHAVEYLAQVKPPTLVKVSVPA
jgi:DNA-binding response OmpR family regulator